MSEADERLLENILDTIPTAHHQRGYEMCDVLEASSSTQDLSLEVQPLYGRIDRYGVCTDRRAVGLDRCEPAGVQAPVRSRPRQPRRRRIFCASRDRLGFRSSFSPTLRG